jgi:hypothetical protein
MSVGPLYLSLLILNVYFTLSLYAECVFNPTLPSYTTRCVLNVFNPHYRCAQDPPCRRVLHLLPQQPHWRRGLPRAAGGPGGLLQRAGAPNDIYIVHVVSYSPSSLTPLLYYKCVFNPYTML